MNSSYFIKVFPTYIENWNSALYKLSIPQIDIRLTREEVPILGRNIWKFGKWFGDTPRQSMKRIEEKIEKALYNFPKGAFVRLGSRSGKDSLYAQHFGLRITHADAAIKILTEASERIAFDLHLALQNDYCPHIFVRQWIEIPRWAEFRCFMRDRELVGISQYDCKNMGHCPEIVKHQSEIKYGIRFFFEKFRTASHLNDVVFDVFAIIDKNQTDIKLLELNPFFPKTDACLFDWNLRDFDGSFRIL